MEQKPLMELALIKIVLMEVAVEEPILMDRLGILVVDIPVTALRNRAEVLILMGFVIMVIMVMVLVAMEQIAMEQIVMELLFN